MSHDHDRPDPALERALGELLHDAVRGIEPDDRLGELRARVARPPRRRIALTAVLGAAVAGVAAVAAVVVGPQLLGGDDDPQVASSPSPSAAESAEPSPDEPSSRVPTATRTVAGYYLGDTPDGVRLYREFRAVEAADDGTAASVGLLTSAPADPDYRTLWPSGAFAGAEVDADRITVELADTSLEERPDSMSEEEAEASVQQVVYTLQAYAQQRLPVEFTTSDGPAPQVLGTDTDEPVAAGAQLDVLSHVMLNDPTEGQAFTDRFRVFGEASSNEANVPWTLTDEDGQVVDEGFFTATGFLPPRLYPFEDVLDLGSLAPGTYVLEVRTDDPSGGAEGSGPYTDTRSIVVE